MVFDQQTLQAITGQIGQASQQMQQALEGIPADQRALLEQAMPGKFPSRQAPRRSPPVVHRLNSRANVYGYACVLHEVRRDNRKTSDAFVTDWKNIEGGAEIVQGFTEMGGFPVATREYRDDGSLEGESALRSAKRMRLAPADFEPPKGYRRQEMFGGGSPFGPPGGQGNSSRQPRR